MSLLGICFWTSSGNRSVIIKWARAFRLLYLLGFWNGANVLKVFRASNVQNALGVLNALVLWMRKCLLQRLVQFHWKTWWVRKKVWSVQISDAHVDCLVTGIKDTFLCVPIRPYTHLHTHLRLLTHTHTHTHLRPLTHLRLFTHTWDSSHTHTHTLETHTEKQNKKCVFKSSMHGGISAVCLWAALSWWVLIMSLCCAAE